MMMTLAFLGIYFAVYAISGMFFKRGDPNFNASNGTSVDMIVFAITIIIAIVYYYNLSESDQTNFFDDLKKTRVIISTMHIR